jgi:phage/plasmid-like protein (TIGR03299 family)
MPDGIDTMAYNREKGKPWHGKGEAVDGLMTAAECIRKAGLDWGVAKVPLRINDEGGLPLSGVAALVRTDKLISDRSRVLGIVGDEYQPLQNWDAFTFFDAAVGKDKARYETAGSIDDGKRIWLLASLGAPFEPVRDDRVEPYLLLANGHDGRLMVHLKFTPVRVVCQNTLAMALVDKDRRHVALRHDRTLKRRLAESGTLFQRIRHAVDDTADAWKRMAACRITTKNAEAYFRSVFGGTSGLRDDSEDADAEQPGGVSPEADVDRPLLGLKKYAMDDFESKQNRELKIIGTLWAAYNAVVWAVDYRRPTSRDLVDDLCLADGARLKEKAKREAERVLATQQGGVM